MASTTVVLADITAGLSTLTNAIPILGAAYSALKLIWMATHPGETEAQYIAYLLQVSTTDAAQDTAWLIAHGYTQNAAGAWVAPAP